jgi:ketosteroid isomerase-like protein
VSQEHVQIAKRAIDAYNRRDPDAYDDLFTPDFEWFPAISRTVEGGSYQGREGVDTRLGEIGEAWQGVLRVVPGEFRDSATACSCSVGSRDAGEAAASRSMRRSG